MSEGKRARDDALKNLGAARKGEKRRMDQYEENVSEEEYDSDELEQFRKDKKNKKRKKEVVSHDITKFMDPNAVTTNAMEQVSPPKKKTKNQEEDQDEILGDTGTKHRLFGASTYNFEKEIVPAPQTGLNIRWCDIQRESNVELKRVENREGKKVVRIYWFDATYNERNNVIFIFGKAETVTGVFVSCCIVVDDMLRTVHLLPKRFAESPFTADLNNPSQENEQLATELRDAVVELADSQRIPMPYMIKFVKKKYAFEEPGVPYEENTYLKLSYSYKNSRALSLPKEHATFSKEFGVNQSPLELFLLKRKIRGPCWLEVDWTAQHQKDTKSMDEMGSTHGTWCRTELKAAWDSIRVSNDQSKIPTLSVMSLKIKTFLNEKKKVNEIAAINAVVHDSVVIDGPTPRAENGFSKFTLVRKMDHNDATLPVGNETTLQNEFALLNLFINKLHRIDPDIIVGHNFLAYDLDVLLHRMKSHGTMGWSKLGRLRLSNWPKLQTGPGGMSESTREEKKVMAGRLVCDTYLSSKEYLKESSYGLNALAVSQLGAEEVKEDVVQENDAYTVHKYVSSQEGVDALAGHLEYNSLNQLKLMFKLSLLPLTKELTNVAGNLWSKTLTGSRSERIEYLLLHEFFNRKYLIPDKTFLKNSFGGKRKAAYSGGLVLEPMKGLYDKYVLLLDFNSLYPSIILENNLCFTTVERPRRDLAQEAETNNTQNRKNNNKKGQKKQQPLPQQELDEMTDADTPAEPEAEEEKKVFEAQPPEPGLKTAILPSVIGSLLEKRKNAKFEMSKASKDGDKNREWQCNIRQLALKLTANSTYGCLGFMYSRFYCQPIAELITRLGRQILRDTKEKIEQSKDLGYTVIYGDTDSVMVLTPFVQYDEAYKVGEKIQSFINRGNRYLEIGIDGLFRRILLLRKKKYVAVVHSKRDGVIQSNVENKGIDMVRRDWCELSRDVSQFCVDQILKTSNTGEGNTDTTTAEDVVTAIHNHLREVRQEVNIMDLPLAKFVITKGLTKAPEDYPDSSHQPHVQVALEMRRRGIPVRVGQRIPYVICSKSLNPNPRTIADRAVHPDLFEEGNRKVAGTYVIDTEWYLSQQIYPPVYRLCEHMEGTDSKMLADCLGLDKHKYSGSSSYSDVNAHLDYVMMSEWNDDDDKYNNVKLKAFICPSCGSECKLDICDTIVNHVLERSVKPSYDTPELLKCKNCSANFLTARICNWLTKNIRQQLQKYYEGWLVVPHHVSKAAGQNRTRISSMTPKHGVISGMVVSVREEFNAQDLQLHLQYYQTMFDLEKAGKRAQRILEQKEESMKATYLKELGKVKALIEQGKELENLEVIKSKVNRFLDKNGRQWVQLDDLFRSLRF